eukprot:303193_1
MNANEEDSSGESDDDIVLDQSLATTHQTVPLTSHILTHNQIHSNPVQIQQKQQKQAIIVNNKPKSIVTPTIVTICPPTLKSNKNNNNINIKKKDNNNNNNNNLKFSQSALPTITHLPPKLHHELPDPEEEETEQDDDAPLQPLYDDLSPHPLVLDGTSEHEIKKLHYFPSEPPLKQTQSHTQQQQQ